MKNLFKKLALITSAVTLVLSIGGCTNLQKQAVLIEYTNSLSEDSVQWSIIGDASNKMQSTTKPELLVAQIDTEVLHNLDTIVTNAENRNSAITDPEILSIDKHYLGMAKNLQQGFKNLCDGYKLKDEKTLEKAMTYLNASMEEAKGFVDEFEAYTNRYDINTSGAMDDFKKQIEALEGQ